MDMQMSTLKKKQQTNKPKYQKTQRMFRMICICAEGVILLLACV